VTAIQLKGTPLYLVNVTMSEMLILALLRRLSNLQHSEMHAPFAILPVLVVLVQLLLTAPTVRPTMREHPVPLRVYARDSSTQPSPRTPATCAPRVAKLALKEAMLPNV
jgi:hypothetical protein